MANVPFTFDVTPLTPQRFQSMLATTQAAQRVSLVETTETTGTVNTPDVTFSYAYDGSETVTVTVLGLNSFLARHASEGTIESHIRSLALEG